MPLLYDQLLINPYVDKEIKQKLRECMVVEATNVSNYYFEGTDQEYWDLAKDFPNVAPPFETFFLEFRAPHEIVSSKTGIIPWPKTQPLKWGILCLGGEKDDLMPDLDTDEGRTDYLKYNTSQIEMLHQVLGTENVQKLNALWAMRDSAKTRVFIAQSPQNIYRSMQLYIMALTIRLLLNEGKWSEVKKLLGSGQSSVIRWQLGGILFAQFRNSSLQHQLGPFWGWEMHIGPDGQLLTKSDGEVEMLYQALGNVETTIKRVIEKDHKAGLDLFEEMRGSFDNQLRTMLLAISFMHCKNVTLTEVKPCHPKPLPIRQRKRGELPRHYVTYHILDIEPMKQVLKTEGQSEKIGIQRSLHICRGHFAHYGEDKKLFGKYAGTFWIPQHVRGSQDVGIAVKDYRITKIKGGVK